MTSPQVEELIAKWMVFFEFREEKRRKNAAK